MCGPTFSGLSDSNWKELLFSDLVKKGNPIGKYVG